MDQCLHLDRFLCVLSRALFVGFDKKGFQIKEMTQAYLLCNFIFFCFPFAFSRTEAPVMHGSLGFTLLIEIIEIQ